METLKDYSDFLLSKGYSLAPYSHSYFNGFLTDVTFVKNGYRVILQVGETEEFTEYLESLEPNIEYLVEDQNYIVSGAFIESPICNIAGFLDGNKEGITLVKEANDYYTDTLDLFEYCITLQTPNLLEHELKIMSERIKLLSWAKDVLIPVLEKCDYIVDYDSFFIINFDKFELDSSSPVICFRHYNDCGNIYLETHCITGKNTLSVGGIGLDVIGKSQEEIYSILLEEVFKKDELAFGYLYNNDPKETKDTYKEVLTLWQELRNKSNRYEINFDIIPDRYSKDIELYKQLNSE